MAAAASSALTFSRVDPDGSMLRRISAVPCIQAHLGQIRLITTSITRQATAHWRFPFAHLACAQTEPLRVQFPIRRPSFSLAIQAGHKRGARAMQARWTPRKP